MKIISPMLDIMFKRMFSMPDNKEMLKDFLSSFIDFKEGELKDIKLIDKEIRRTPQEKNSILDLRVETGSTEVDVEVQLQNTAAIKPRIAYYLAKMYSDQLKEGDSYDKLHKCVSFCIFDFSIENDEHYFRQSVFRDNYGNVLTDKMECVCLEISKIRKLELTNAADKKLQWGKLLAATSEEDLNMVNEKSNNPAIEQAVLTVKKLSADEEMRLEAFAREKEYRDRISMIESARAEGRAEERAKLNMEIANERAKHDREIARIAAAMRASGMSDEMINSILNAD